MSSIEIRSQIIPYGAMKSFARVVLVNLGILLGLIVVAELIFGTWLFGPSYGLMNIPRDENRLVDVSQFVPDSKLIRYTRDEYGLRGDYGGDPARIDVLAMGGSTTDERYIDDSQTWVAQLQDQFRQHGKPLVFANAAIDGQSTVGHINAMTLWLPQIPDLRPHYILFYIGINDIFIGDDRAQYDQMASPSRSRRIRQYITNHSALYNFYRTVRGMILADKAQLMHGRIMRRVARWILVDEPTDVNEVRRQTESARAAFGERLRILTRMSRDIGAEPIFITQRRTDQKTENGKTYVLAMPDADGQFPVHASDNFDVLMRLYNETTLANCAEIGVTCVDLATRIDFAEDDFYDAIHTTPRGSKKIAKFLYGELADKLQARP
jgi:hypothetical protein